MSGVKTYQRMLLNEPVAFTLFIWRNGFVGIADDAPLTAPQVTNAQGGDFGIDQPR